MKLLDNLSSPKQAVEKLHLLRCARIASLQRTGLSTPPVVDFSRASESETFLDSLVTEFFNTLERVDPYLGIQRPHPHHFRKASLKNLTRWPARSCFNG